MPPSLTDSQLRAELERCQSCETRPCRGGCPANCSPGDFILAARGGEPSDYRRAAALILGPNPLGGVCGSVCPETLCMARCSRRALDAPIDIPAVQGAIIQRARALGVLPRLEPQPPTGQRVAVVGAGPAGLGAASVLARAGHSIHVFDREAQAGGMARLIPRRRLDPEVLEGDLAWLAAQGDVQLHLGEEVPLPRELLGRGFAAVIVAAGLGEPVALDVPGRERALDWGRVLGARPPALRGKRVAIVGGGRGALDCAEAALAQGASHVEILALETLSELGLAPQERDRLFAPGVHATFRVRVTAIRGSGKGRGARITSLSLRKVELPAGQAFHPGRLVDLPHGEHERRDFDAVIAAIGGEAGLARERHPRVLYAGDLADGGGSVVEALASGKRAAAEVVQMLAGDEAATCPDRPSCPEGGGACPKRATCPEWNRKGQADGQPASARPGSELPVSLECEFRGRMLRSPFLLACPPFTATYEQVKRAYEAGWAGAVVGEALPATDAERLRHEFPDRVTLSPRDGPDALDPRDYRDAAALLARGEQAVRVDALVRRLGLGALDELQAGLAYHLAERGLRSLAELAGSAAPGADPHGTMTAYVTDAALCTGCGNCTRCPRLAIALDARGVPTIEAARCDGCGLCVEQCFVGAIGLRPAPAAANG